MKLILLVLLSGLSLGFLTACSSNKVINCDEFDINYNRVSTIDCLKMAYKT